LGVDKKIRAEVNKLFFAVRYHVGGITAVCVMLIASQKRNDAPAAGTKYAI
jgi:hypothetical protein